MRLCARRRADEADRLLGEDERVVAPLDHEERRRLAVDARDGTDRVPELGILLGLAFEDHRPERIRHLAEAPIARAVEEVEDAVERDTGLDAGVDRLEAGLEARDRSA